MKADLIRIKYSYLCRHSSRPDLFSDKSIGKIEINASARIRNLRITLNASI